MDLFGKDIESYSKEILILNPPDINSYNMIKKQIDKDYIELYGSSLAEYYGGHEKFMESRRASHPLYSVYLKLHNNINNVIYLKERIRKNFKIIISLKIFTIRWKNDFLMRYYSPDGGKGYLEAKKRFKQYIRC